ncbi:MAG TPA: MFS transporter, partial [Pseudonocardia sp.]|uniref:MFS transporter n=1 Tax=Pseudonocardia sp. TaxID=60912 RepID=UPI002BDE971A
GGVLGEPDDAHRRQGAARDGRRQPAAFDAGTDPKPVLLPESRDPDTGRLDLVSAAMSLAAVLGIVYGLKRTAVDGPDVPAVLAVLAGLAVGAAFLRRQRALTHPLIDLTLFGSARFDLALVAQLCVNAAWAGTYLFVTQHLQLVAGLSPVVAGLWTLPGVAAGVVTSTLVPRLVGRVRPEMLLAGVLAVSAAGCVVLATAGVGIGVVVTGAAIVMAMASAVVAVSTDVIVGSAPPERAGAASSVSETSSELGIAFGVALLGAAGAAAYRDALVVPSGIADSAWGTLGGALDIARGQPDGAAVADAARSAFLTGMHVAAWVGAAIMAAATASALVISRRTRASDPAATTCG